jgi:hypothetical protein
MDIAEVQTEEGKLHLFVYRIHTLLTENGIQFAKQERHKWAFKLLFDRVCDQHQIEHRLNKLMDKTSA